MRIPRRGLEKFVREVSDQCTVSQSDRAKSYQVYTNYFNSGSDDPTNPADYNKTFAYMDELESLLYSPVSLKALIGDPELPNVLQKKKGQAAASKLRSLARSSDTDTKISQAVGSALLKGKSFLKQTWKRGAFSPEVVQPEVFGVFNEAHDKLDEDMEAFSHSMAITPYQFERLIAGHPDRDTLRRKSKRMTGETATRPGANMTITTGGLYPFQPQGSSNPNNSRGLADWMSSPSPNLSAKLVGEMLRLDETWIWDDARGDWTTFQIIGD